VLLPEADFWVGIEGGVQECAFPDCADEMMAFAWVVILKDDAAKEQRGGKMKTPSTAQQSAQGAMIGKGRTGTFFLPKAVVRLVRQGMELGEADDAVFGRSNSKQENGAVGILTGDVIDRARLYEQAVALALIPFRNQELYR
jgi:non-canonical (house-cleaning) NTP pyrophosphatase